MANKEIQVAVAEVVDYLKMMGTFAPALHDVVRRKVTAEEAKRRGIRISKNELQRTADAFRVMNGLHKASDTEAWLKSNGLTVETFEEFLQTNLLIKKFKDSLEKKVNKNKYLSSPALKETLRDTMYEDWVAKTLK